MCCFSTFCCKIQMRATCYLKKCFSSYRMKKRYSNLYTNLKQQNFTVYRVRQHHSFTFSFTTKMKKKDLDIPLLYLNLFFNSVCCWDLWSVQYFCIKLSFSFLFLSNGYKSDTYVFDFRQKLSN